MRIVRDLPTGATELCCHPAVAGRPDLAYGEERVRELEALCDPRVRAALAEAGVRLGTFPEVLRDLPAPVA